MSTGANLFHLLGVMLNSLEQFIETKLDQLADYARMRENMDHPSTLRGLTDIGYTPISQAVCQSLRGDDNVDIAIRGIPLDSDTVDAIVTDPPYGYGSDLEDDGARQLYEKFFREAFRVLKPGGRIVMCVLDKVRTGKNVSPDVMTQGVVNLANDVAKDEKVFFLADSLRPSGPDDLLLSYWKAQHKLNRGILSFRIDKGLPRQV